MTPTGDEGFLDELRELSSELFPRCSNHFAWHFYCANRDKWVGLSYKLWQRWCVLPMVLHSRVIQLEKFFEMFPHFNIETLAEEASSPAIKAQRLPFYFRSKRVVSLDITRTITNRAKVLIFMMRAAEKGSLMIQKNGLLRKEIAEDYRDWARQMDKRNIRTIRESLGRIGCKAKTFCWVIAGNCARVGGRKRSGIIKLAQSESFTVAPAAYYVFRLPRHRTKPRFFLYYLDNWPCEWSFSYPLRLAIEIRKRRRKVCLVPRSSPILPPSAWVDGCLITRVCWI